MIQNLVWVLDMQNYLCSILTRLSLYRNILHKAQC